MSKNNSLYRYYFWSKGLMTIINKFIILSVLSTTCHQLVQLVISETTYSRSRFDQTLTQFFLELDNNEDHEYLNIIDLQLFEEEIRLFVRIFEFRFDYIVLTHNIYICSINASPYLKMRMKYVSTYDLRDYTVLLLVFK